MATHNRPAGVRPKRSGTKVPDQPASGSRAALWENDRPAMLNRHCTKFQQAFEQVCAVCVAEAIVKRIGPHAVTGRAVYSFCGPSQCQFAIRGCYLLKLPLERPDVVRLPHQCGQAGIGVIHEFLSAFAKRPGDRVRFRDALKSDLHRFRRQFPKCDRDLLNLSFNCSDLTR
jgi:hypothetical protein